MAGPVLRINRSPGRASVGVGQPPAATLHLAKAPENSESPSPRHQGHEETVQVRCGARYSPASPPTSPCTLSSASAGVWTPVSRSASNTSRLTVAGPPSRRGLHHPLGLGHAHRVPPSRIELPAVDFRGTRRPDIKRPLRLRWQFAGWEHESTAALTNIARTAAGSDSRSINTGFIRPTFVWEVERPRHAHRRAQGLRLLRSRERDRDINEYRGYADLLLKYRTTTGFSRRSCAGATSATMRSSTSGMPMGDFLYLFTRGRRRDLHGWVLLPVPGRLWRDHARIQPAHRRAGARRPDDRALDLRSKAKPRPAFDLPPQPAAPFPRHAATRRAPRQPGLPGIPVGGDVRRYLAEFLGDERVLDRPRPAATLAPPARHHPPDASTSRPTPTPPSGRPRVRRWWSPAARSSGSSPPHSAPIRRSPSPCGTVVLPSPPCSRNSPPAGDGLAADPPVPALRDVELGDGWW